MLTAVKGQGYHTGNVSVQGLTKTDRSFLNRYIALESNAPFTLEALHLTEQRLRNLQFFSELEYNLDTVQQEINVSFKVKEVHTVIPWLGFGGLSSVFFLSAGVTENNLLGKGNKLFGSYTYYQRHSAELGLTIPYVANSDFGFTTIARKYSTIEPLIFPDGRTYYDYDNYSFELIGQYEIAIDHFVYLGGSIFQENYQKRPDDVEVADGKQSIEATKSLLKIQHWYKKINYYYHYLDGFSNLFFAENVFTHNYNESFFKIQNETKAFKRLGKRGNVAMRLVLGYSTNNNAPFAPFVLDSYINVRGVGNRVIRGTALLITNLEYRYTVWQPSWGALQSNVFFDMGAIRSPGGRISDINTSPNLETFSGLGVRLVINQLYNTVLRLDYGVDISDNLRGGFVAGLGQFF